MSFLRRWLAGPEPEPEHHHSDEPVPGWDAIDAALRPIYGDVEPLHWGTVVRWSMGGPDPLDGISAYRAAGPPAHWHFVTYGLSELYRKESDDPGRSGWGIELTFRLARPGAADQPPMWPIDLLQNLARYVFESARVLEPGDHMDLNGPIELGRATDIRAIALTVDPELGRIDTPHGSLAFSQIVGITLDEYAAIQAWDTVAFLDLVRGRDPLLVTDLDRRSYLADAELAATVAARTAAEGSAMGEIAVDRLAWHADDDRLIIVVGAIAVPRIHRMIEGRLLLGRGFLVSGPAIAVAVRPATALDWQDVGDGKVDVGLPDEVAGRVVSQVLPIAGTYDVADRLRIEVERTVVIDQSGAEVDVVG